MRTPSYRKHASGQAVVQIGRKSYYLGLHGSTRSKERYKDVLAQHWHPKHDQRDEYISIEELLAKYLIHAEGYYSQSNEVEHIKLAMRPLRALAGELPVDRFGPRLLEQIRDRMVAEGLTRQGANKRIVRIRRIFKWGVSKELVPPSVLQGLQALAPLARGRTSAREAPKVLPVPQDALEATLVALPAVVADMVRFQLLTACRPGEVCAMRRVELETGSDIWVYRPSSHKCSWRGQSREIFIGPQAVEILRRWLPADLQGHVFSPRRFYNRPRLLDHYTSRTYSCAIKQACRKAGIPSWGPNRLRHSAATFIQSRYGIEAARAICGHAKPNTTAIYAERDSATAKKIALEVG